MTSTTGNLKLLFVSTSVGPIGSGRGGGVELTLANMVKELGRRGHQCTVIAPRGSILPGIHLIETAGTVQPYAQYQGRDAPIVMPPAPVLGAMWDAAARLQPQFDLIVNLAYDWLPFYLTPFLRTPVVHLISMGSLSDAMDDVICRVARSYPSRVAVHTRAQGATFPCASLLRPIGTGMNLDLYPYNHAPERRLCWVGRIAPEKGLEDAVAVAQTTGLPLEICGTLQDQEYWSAIRREFPDAPIAYHGFLDTTGLAAVMGNCCALLMTPKWVEALGNVAIEALACGTPVIAYRRGGPAEIVEDGRTGWLVEPDSVPDLIAAVESVEALDRRACHAQAAREYSLPAWGERLEAWFAAAVLGQAEARYGR